MRVRRALFSAYRKEGLLPLAQAVRRHGGEIISSGGTADYLRAQGIEVTTVESITGLGSLFGGRVKTLHPMIHGGILFRRDDPEDVRAATEAGIRAIDLVVVNLYPFAEARAAGVGGDEAIELIDVGGPAMVRAAAKNHRHVAVVTRPEDYDPVREALDQGEGTLDPALLVALAARAFATTAAYDAAIASWLDPTPGLPTEWTPAAPRRRLLRYGENPSQTGGLFGRGNDFPFDLEQLHGKELSYNNYLDLSCGRDLLGEFGAETVAAVIKHGIPCGVARDDDLAVAYRRARDADALSAFGGVVCLNGPVDATLASLLNESFLEVVLAPDYSAEALDLLRSKKNRVLLRCPDATLREPAAGIRGRFCGSGFLLQTALPPGSGEAGWSVATARAPDERESADLVFGWKVLKHVRSNAILLARDGSTRGVGSGQCSRIDALVAAIHKASRSDQELRGAVMVSDAFFPFRDSVDRAHEAGITAVLQPGGSVRDEESIRACDEHGMAMALNGARCFSHG